MQFVLTTNFQNPSFINGEIDRCLNQSICQLLIVPSFNSTAPTTFFSFTTLTLFSFSHWTTIKPIFRSVILSKTVEKRNNLKLEQLTDEKYIQRWAPVFFLSDHRHDHVGLLAKKICWLGRLQSQEKRAKLSYLFWLVLFSWMVDTLDPCFDDDINNDVNSLYVEVIDKNRTRMHDLWPKVFEERKTRNPLELCSRQRWKQHKPITLGSMRNTDDHSISVPKSTMLDRNKRSATRSNTASHLDSSVGLSTELAVVPTESSASHNGENICTRDRSNYMRLQRCIGILVCKWLCTVRSVTELGKGWRERRYKVVILYYK